jgi:hypothetical protein
MKIEAPPSATAPAMSQSQARFGEETERQPENFPDLLAAMLSAAQAAGKQGTGSTSFSPSNPQAVDNIRAADFSPQIGTHGKAFERGSLLVETALVFDGPQKTGERQPEHVPVAQSATDLLKSKPELRVEQRGDPTFSGLPQTFGELLADWCTRFAPVPTAGEVEIPTAEGGLRSFPPSPVKAAPSAVLESQPVTQVQSQAIREAKAPRLLELPPAAGAPPRTSKQISPFGAQLLAFEGGLRLVLRVPRLADNERTELEAALAHLFERFGHRRHEIVINEIGNGQS